MVYLSRPYHFKFFKGCLPQISLGLFLHTLSHLVPSAFPLRLNLNQSKLLSVTTVLQKRFHALFFCVYCWLKTCKCQLGQKLFLQRWFLKWNKTATGKSQFKLRFECILVFKDGSHNNKASSLSMWVLPSLCVFQVHVYIYKVINHQKAWTQNNKTNIYVSY